MIIKAVTSLLSGLFGSSQNGKSIVTEVADVVDRFNPSDATKHKQSIEAQKAGDSSQKNAYGLTLKSHESWFDIFVDGLNRLPRPLLTLWVIGILYDWWPSPDLKAIHPVIQNIMWTIVTFWFGARTLTKDLPAAISLYQNYRQERKDKSKILKEQIVEKLNSEYEESINDDNSISSYEE